MRLSFLSLLCCFAMSVQSATLHVGAGQTYATLSAAVNAVAPGDTILIHSGSYAGGLFFANLQGNASQWITIKNAPGANVVFEGGTNAIQLSDPAYLRVQGLTFQHQTGNGVNVDDGGSYNTPARHVVFENCTFRDMAVSGNNDLLKLSGLDHFEIRNCTFRNGAAGGSGIDMVGCHQGLIANNNFENLGSNSIQCKGGSADVRMEGNFFRNGGQRTLNLGGSTGLAFFRPDTAHYEAANLQVYANVFIGSTAPIAYVGSVNVLVANNTFYHPGNWVVRILQETVDTDRFLPCGDNSFINNIIWLNDDLSTEVNVGPDTAPQSFLFSNNLWYNEDQNNWSGPNLPVAEANTILNMNPLFADAANDDFSIPMNSPAAGEGLVVNGLENDFSGNLYANPPSIGAFEANPATSVNESFQDVAIRVFPNPTQGICFVECTLKSAESIEIQIFSAKGDLVMEQVLIATPARSTLDLSALPNGAYSLRATGKDWTSSLQLLKCK